MNPEEKIKLCLYCGGPLPEREPGKPGQPRATHDECGKIKNYLAAVFRLLEALSDKLNPQQRAAIRSDMQRRINYALNPAAGGKQQKYRDRAQVAGYSRFGGSRAKPAKEAQDAEPKRTEDR